jgi:hypothetical protein
MLGGTRRQLAVASTAALVALVFAVAAWAGGSPIVHKVSAGGPDICTAIGGKPGCNGNYSLQAKQRANGKVTGQYTDQFGHGNGGFHATIDCLYVSGNTAWISGIVKSGTFNKGGRILTEVRDLGKSAKDPPDQISYSYAVAMNFDCRTHPALAMFNTPQGQVKVS